VRIASVAAQTIRWPIASQGAARGRTERAAVVLEVRGDGGAVGLGEAAPLPGMSRDTIDDAERAAAALAARAPFEVADRDAALAIAGVAAPAARFAIETALLDALARHRGVSLAELLCAPAGDPASRQVPLAAVIDDPAEARAAFARGIRCFKVKLGADDDLGRVLAIAAQAPGVRLRIDANRTWPRGEVPARLAALAALPVDYVEEPCVDAHSLLSGPLPCKLALDESLDELTPDQLRAALRSPQLAALVLKPTLLGLAGAIALAEQARRAGVAAIVSHGLEGPIGTAACAELALALGGSQPAGLAAHAALAGWHIAVPQLAADRIQPTTRVGLGFVDLDLATAVRACSIRLP
jgi:L-alanine-DL-glutamate epimerase-like enolase superfamily enzyme